MGMSNAQSASSCQYPRLVVAGSSSSIAHIPIFRAYMSFSLNYLRGLYRALYGGVLKMFLRQILGV